MLPVLAGAGLGLSATMRTESFVATVTFVGGASLFLLARRRVIWALTSGALAVAGFAGPWFLNALLEGLLGHDSGLTRANRVSGASHRPSWTELSVRAKEALITWFGSGGVSFPGSVFLGLLIIGALLRANVLLRRGDRGPALATLGLAAACYVMPRVSGLGFVPGALIVFPVAAAVVILHRWDSERAFVVAVAVVTTVVTWMFQFTGGAEPQWGGRYLLAPTLLLGCVGVVAISDSDRWLRISVVGFRAPRDCLRPRVVAGALPRRESVLRPTRGPPGRR